VDTRRRRHAGRLGRVLATVRDLRLRRPLSADAGKLRSTKHTRRSRGAASLYRQKPEAGASRSDSDSDLAIAP
jgi:hypothetical protein